MDVRLYERSKPYVNFHGSNRMTVLLQQLYLLSNQDRKPTPSREIHKDTINGSP